MKILVIEDNNIKYNLVEKCLQEMGVPHVVKRAASYQSGIANLMKETFDCVVLDMTLTVFDSDHTLVGMDVLTFGGELILRETRRKKLKARFIVLSQYDTFVRDSKEEVTFDELRDELLKKYSDIVLECVRLDSSSVNWKNTLTKLLLNANENPNY